MNGCRIVDTTKFVSEVLGGGLYRVSFVVALAEGGGSLCHCEPARVSWERGWCTFGRVVGDGQFEVWFGSQAVTLTTSPTLTMIPVPIRT
jgi:hypothetical protein